MLVGTGIIGLLINSLPYGDKGPRDIVAFIILIINVSLFAGFNIASAARYIMFPQIWTLMIREPVQSLFLSCYPMALSTIISATVSLSQYRISSMAWLDLLWSLWWIDSALAAGSAVLLPYIMYTLPNLSFSYVLKLPLGSHAIAIPWNNRVQPGYCQLYPLSCQLLVEESWPDHLSMCLHRGKLRSRWPSLVYLWLLG